MGIEQFRQDVDRIHRFCNSRGYGPEAKDYLMQRAQDRMTAFDKLVQDDPSQENRFQPVTDQMLENWISQMSEPTLF